MKTIITLFTAVLLSQALSAQTTLISDANFEQALIDRGYDTGTPDGSVPTANIDMATSLTVQSKSISDLPGVEDFAYNTMHNEIINAGDVGSYCSADFYCLRVYYSNGTNSSPTCEVHFLNGSIGALTYQWDFGDGSTSNQKAPKYTYSTSGTFTIVLNTYDSLGNFCDSTSQVLEMHCGSVGIENVVDPGLSISAYPNPTQDRLFVFVGSEHLGKEFEITDFSGRVVKEGAVTNEKFELSLSEFNNGIYVLVIRGTKTQIKLIKI